LTFDVANVGNLPLVITKAKPPSGAFTTANPLPEGLSIGPGDVVHQSVGPGDVVHQSVTFRPTATGPAAATYLIVSNDGSGDHVVTLTGRGSKKISLPAPKSGPWQLNGGAAVTSAGLQLTGTAKNLRASAFDKTKVYPIGLVASFQVELTGGSGGEGMTFVLADATKVSPTAIGAGSAGLGYAGLPGIAVAFDTVQQPGEPQVPLVGVPVGGSSTKLQYAAATSIPGLRSGWHTVTVTLTTNHAVQVSVDGHRVIGMQIPTGLSPLPPAVYAGFTASSSARTDRHLVRNVKISTLSY
jgi:hypothetical protein